MKNTARLLLVMYLVFLPGKLWAMCAANQTPERIKVKACQIPAADTADEVQGMALITLEDGEEYKYFFDARNALIAPAVYFLS